MLDKRLRILWIFSLFSASRLDLRFGRFDPLSIEHAFAGKHPQPTASHFPRPHAFDQPRCGAQHQVQVVGQHRQKTHVDDEVGDQQFQPFDDPLAAMAVVLAGQRILAQQVRPPATAAPTVIDPRFTIPDDLFAHRQAWAVLP